MNEFVLENAISTPDDFSLRRKDKISERVLRMNLDMSLLLCLYESQPE
jgi:hypothetical protein